MLIKASLPPDNVALKTLLAESNVQSVCLQVSFISPRHEGHKTYELWPQTEYCQTEARTLRLSTDKRAEKKVHVSLRRTTRAATSVPR